MPTQKIHAKKYEELIDRRGRAVKWQEAVICSCWNPDSGQPAYGCQACGGKGFTYEAPYTGTALVMSITQNKDFEEMAGAFDSGDAVMTVPKRIPGHKNGQIDLHNMTDNPMFDIGMYDLVTLMDDEYKTSELLCKGTPLFGRPADTLLNEDVTRVKSLRKSNPDTGEITSYSFGTDFTLSENTIQWVGANQPYEGEFYSVVYHHRPTYTVLTTLPKPRHQDGQDLPRYVVLRYRAGGFDRK